MGPGLPETLHMATFIFLERTCVVSSMFSEGLVTKCTPPRTAVWDQLMRGVYGEGCGLMDLEAENTRGGVWSRFSEAAFEA